MPRIAWKTLYTDLPEKIATTLRETRLQPEQIKAKTDGELLSIKGITDADIETIRSLYPADTVVDTEIKKETKPKTKKATTKKEEAPAPPVIVRPTHHRSARYAILAKMADRTKLYEPTAALELITKFAQARKSHTLELHLNVKEVGLRGEIRLAHSTGKSIKVEIFSADTITKLNASQVDFDVLLATPADMPKLAKYAKILGPKGLMPNPKNGTISANPADRAKELASGATMAYKTEIKAPIIHLTLGTTDQPPAETIENLSAIVKEIGPNKIVSAFLASTQTPSVRLDLSSWR